MVHLTPMVRQTEKLSPTRLSPAKSGEGGARQHRKAAVWSSSVLRPERLNEEPQPGQRLVPLRRDLAQALASAEQRPRFELPDALAAYLGPVGEAGLSEHVQMLRDRLTRDAAAGRQPRDGQGPRDAEPGDDPETRFVTQRCEDRSCRRQLPRPNQ